jgi:hypothetical protein
LMMIVIETLVCDNAPRVDPKKRNQIKNFI